MEYCFDNPFETEFDQAQLLHKLVGHRFVYTYDKNQKGEITKKGSWHELIHFEWKRTDGAGLRSFISCQMRELYDKHKIKLEHEFIQTDPTHDREASLCLQKQIRSISERMVCLKMTNHKDRIMKEAMQLFYAVDIPENPRILSLTVNPRKRCLEELIDNTFSELQSLLTSNKVELLESLLTTKRGELLEKLNNM